MFQMFTSSYQGDQPFLVEVVEPPFQHQKEPKQHVACKYCRQKKLKCSSDPEGCRRCSAKGIPCVYPQQPSSRGGRKNSQSKVTKQEKPASTTVEKQARPQPSPVQEVEIAASLTSHHEMDRSDSASQTGSSSRFGGSSSGFATSTTFSSASSVSGGPLPPSSDIFNANFEMEGFEHMAVNNFELNFDDDREDEFMTSDLEQAITFDNMSPLTTIPSIPSTLPMPDGSSTAWPGSFDPMLPIQETTFEGIHSPDLSALTSAPGGSFPTQTAERRATISSTSSHTHPESVSGQPLPPCQCMRAIMETYEKLSISVNTKNHQFYSSTGNTQRAQEGLLSFMKGVLLRCYAVLECRRCSVCSPTIMLVVTICGNLIHHFKTLRQMLCTTLDAHSRPPSSGQRMSADGAAMMAEEIRGSNKMILGRLNKLDPEDEVSMFKALIWSRMKSYHAILKRLEATADSNGWQGHSSVLKNVDSTFSSLADSFQRLETTTVSDSYS